MARRNSGLGRWQGQSKIVSRYHDIRSIYKYMIFAIYIYTNIENVVVFFFDGPFLFKYTLVGEV